MFNFNSGQKPKETCFVSHGTMGHLDPRQPPTKRKPYSAILGMPFVSKVEFILPSSLYQKMASEFNIPQPRYSRVTLPLSAILKGDFFTEYVKKGDILMLSEGVHGVDNVYSLRDGVLTLTLDKETYERAGIVGKPDGAKGARGTRARWIVEINLREPSMLHGKKGFDRILYVAKNVFGKPVKWLFADLGDEAPSPDPLEPFNPTRVSCEAEITTTSPIHVPLLRPPSADSFIEGVDDFGDFSTDIYEWLSLVQLESPRVNADDSIDPFLSRYTVPETPADSIAEPLVKISWHGFLSPAWAHKSFVEAVIAASSKSWFACALSGFEQSLPAGSRDCTILKIPGRSSEYMLWEVERN